MTTYTKEQIESKTLTPIELVSSWTSGQGNPTSSELYTKNLKEVECWLATKPISEMQLVLQARGIIDLMRQGLTEKSKSAFVAGYAGGPNHFDQYNKATPAKKQEPLEGHVMTSSEWRQSCIDKLPKLPEPDYIGAMELIATITETMTKAQQWAIVCEAMTLVNVKTYTINDCTAEQQEKFFDLLNKEVAIAEATSVLGVYLDCVEPMPKTDNMVRGRYPVLSGTMPLFKQLVNEEKWELIGAPVASTDGEYMTFTVKVI